jgi:HD superfamily phosphohydrolase
MGHTERSSEETSLRALLSDVCHSAHSHALDWIAQGVGQLETLHDERRETYAEAVGVNEILRRYGFDPHHILREEKDGIFDANMPDLDVDRVDYTLREGYRWVAQVPEYRSLLNKDSFTVRDGQLVCRDRVAAKLFAITYTLLVTEHWQEPAHRLQLELFMESMKRLFVSRNGRREDVGTYSPLDYLMVTDDTLQRLADDHDEYLPMMHELMRGVSESESNNRWRARAERARAALTTGIGEESSSIDWITAHYDTLPRSYEINTAHTSTLRNGRYATLLYLDKLRKRAVDPLFIDTDGDVKRLGKEDEAYREYESRAIGNVQQDWRAAIIGNELSTKALKACLKENKAVWPSIMARSRMPNSVLRELLRQTVRTSNGAAAQTIECTIHP